MTQNLSPFMLLIWSQMSVYRILHIGARYAPFCSEKEQTTAVSPLNLTPSGIALLLTSILTLKYDICLEKCNCNVTVTNILNISASWRMVLGLELRGFVWGYSSLVAGDTMNTPRYYHHLSPSFNTTSWKALSWRHLPPSFLLSFHTC